MEIKYWNKLAGRVENFWSDITACSGPRLSNSWSSLLGVASAGTLKLNFVAKMWQNWKKFLKILFYRYILEIWKLEKKTFWP